MCENMAISSLCSVSKVCAVSEALCLVSDGHYTESNNCSVSNEEKERRTLWGCVSYAKKRETRVMGVCLVYQEKGDTHYEACLPFT
jgi:hypothetical protein